MQQLRKFQIIIIFLFWGCNKSIIWVENRKLTFNNFKYKPNVSGKTTGLTASKITYYYKFKKNKVLYNSNAYFNNKKSWVKYKDSSILNHEQRHFDIAEYTSRLFLIKLDSLNNMGILNKNNFMQKHQFCYLRINKISHLMQKQYDDETNHGELIERQALWNNKIDSLLNETRYIRNDLKNHIVNLSN